MDFLVDGIDAEWNFHKDWIDVVKVILPKPLIPGRNIIIETPFFVKLPKVISRLGHTGKHYEITQWYPKPAVYDKDGWHPMPYLNMGEFYSEFGSFDVKITFHLWRQSSLYTYFSGPYSQASLALRIISSIGKK